MRKICKTCNGLKYIKNPKYDNDQTLYFDGRYAPKDYYITCPECEGTGVRGRHK